MQNLAGLTVALERASLLGLGWGLEWMDRLTGESWERLWRQLARGRGFRSWLLLQQLVIHVVICWNAVCLFP